MQADKSYNLQLVMWKPRRANDTAPVQIKCQRTRRVDSIISFRKPASWRAKKADVSVQI